MYNTSDMMKSNFDRLRREKGLRDNVDLSARKVAAATGLSPTTVLKVSKGDIGAVQVRTLETLCRYFGLMSLCELLEYNPEVAE